MIPITPVGILSGGMKTMRSIGGKHQHLVLILIQFWESLTPEICSRYIGHLKKVITKVVEVNVGPFGYFVLHMCTCTLSTLL